MLDFEVFSVVNICKNYKLFSHLLTVLLTPGNNRFHRVNCEGKLLDNGMNTPICRLENDRKTLDFLLEKCQNMREYRVFKYP